MGEGYDRATLSRHSFLIDFQPLVDKVVAKFNGWNGRNLNHAGRLTLVKRVEENELNPMPDAPPLLRIRSCAPPQGSIRRSMQAWWNKGWEENAVPFEARGIRETWNPSLAPLT
nr:unnamed protein product [Digitaria exilis]